MKDTHWLISKKIKDMFSLEGNIYEFLLAFVICSLILLLIKILL